MDSQTALKQLEALREKYSRCGAADTEGRYAVIDVEDAVRDGKQFPFKPKTDRVSQMLPFNPFQLYSSVPGWEIASDELVGAAYAYWKALTEEKLGITIA